MDGLPVDRPVRPPNERRAIVQGWKNKRNGWALRDTGLSDPVRLDRLILVLALAYLLLMGVGLIAAVQEQLADEVPNWG